MSNNKPQTAVERFFMALQIRGLLPNDDIVKCYEEAKQKEKEQIVNAFNIGDMFSADYFDGCSTSESENYYNETYGGNK
jgi:hypothetical protein